VYQCMQTVHSIKYPPVQLRDNLADSFGSTSGGWDDILEGTTAVTPRLSGWAIDSLLGGSHGVNGSHQSLLNSKLVIDDLERSYWGIYIYIYIYIFIYIYI